MKSYIPKAVTIANGYRARMFYTPSLASHAQVRVSTFLVSHNDDPQKSEPHPALSNDIKLIIRSTPRRLGKYNRCITDLEQEVMYGVYHGLYIAVLQLEVCRNLDRDFVVFLVYSSTFNLPIHNAISPTAPKPPQPTEYEYQYMNHPQQNCNQHQHVSMPNWNSAS